MSKDLYRKTADASIHTLDTHSDNRGILLVQDLSIFPVSFVRLFVLEGIEVGSVRGKHAHKECWLFAFASSSGITLKIKNTMGVKTFVMRPSIGVLIPPYNWIEVYFEDNNSKLNVLASKPYDADDYIYTSPLE